MESLYEGSLNSSQITPKGGSSKNQTISGLTTQRKKLKNFCVYNVVRR